MLQEAIISPVKLHDSGIQNFKEPITIVFHCEICGQTWKSPPVTNTLDYDREYGKLSSRTFCCPSPRIHSYDKRY